MPRRGGLHQRRVTRFQRSDLKARDRYEVVARSLADGFQSVCFVPLRSQNGSIGVLALSSRRDRAFDEIDTDFAKQVATQVAIALDNARAYRRIEELNHRLNQEKVYVESELQTALHFDEIVGDSPALTEVMRQITKIASTDTTVLILGETGTGKELVARAIHKVSPRSAKAFVKINCASVPSGLLESELFGHEKGAFTNAFSQKIGRLELADGGTFFLDEIGEMPLELQPKLLRVLQDHEFERLGSTRTIRVNMHLIAATNRDLGQAMSEGTFRSDLFYRLNVFPIRMPPLSERRTDIPKLIAHFVGKYAKRMNKCIETVPSQTIETLMNWDWPGNIRELENFIERSVILTPGATLQAPLSELEVRPSFSATSSESLESVERDYIVRVLKESRGLIAGPNGAAAATRDETNDPAVETPTIGHFAPRISVGSFGPPERINRDGVSPTLCPAMKSASLQDLPTAVTCHHSRPAPYYVGFSSRRIAGLKMNRGQFSVRYLPFRRAIRNLTNGEGLSGGSLPVGRPPALVERKPQPAAANFASNLTYDLQSGPADWTFLT